MRIVYVYTLLKVITYYDLSVLSMSVVGFQQKKFGWGGGVGGVSCIQVFFLDFWKLFSFAKPLMSAGYHSHPCSAICRVYFRTRPFFLSMLRAWAVFNYLIWWVIVND